MKNKAFDVGDMVNVRNPPFDAGRQGLVVEVVNTPYGWSSLVLLADGEYFLTNTLHCELIEEKNGNEQYHRDDRPH